MIKQLLLRFHRDRGGVIMLIFALSVVPLTLLVGLSIDYSFYAQARSQFSLAGDAAATYAVREASATYAVQNQADAANPTNPPYPNSATTAAAAGVTAGNNWFATQLATLPTSYVLGGEASTNTTGLTTTVTATNCGGGTGGFSATVNYVGVYPPFFDFLFKSRANWYVIGTSVACTSYDYAEVLLLLDTSGSMLIGANQSYQTTVLGTSPIGTTEIGDIASLDENSVCIPNADMVTAGVTPFGDGSPLHYDTSTQTPPNQYVVAPLNATAYQVTATYNPPYYPYDLRVGDHLDWSQVKNYAPGTTYGTYTTAEGGGTYAPNGTCNSGYSGPYNPCAFACHDEKIVSTDPTTYFTISGGIKVPKDLYGLARSLNPNQTPSSEGGVTLRIDAVFNATEQVLQDMLNSEQVTGQFTAGVYQFNDNASPIVHGSSGSDPSTEATSNLATALQDVEADDWMKTPTETTVPILAENPNYPGENEDYTDFANAMSELYSGDMTDGTVGSSYNGTSVGADTIASDNTAQHGTVTLSALTASGDGTSAVANGNGTGGPNKVLIIVTDGLDDTNPGFTFAQNEVDRQMGPMTSVKAEEGTTGTCRLFKNLGYTIYVLDIAYYPIPINTYYLTYNDNSSTPYIAEDYTGAVSSLDKTYNFNNNYSGGVLQEWVEGPTTTDPNGTNAYNLGDGYANYPIVTDPDTTLSAVPVTAALQACAGTSTSTSSQVGSYVFAATSASDITTAMNTILASALNGAIRISQ